MMRQLPILWILFAPACALIHRHAISSHHRLRSGSPSSDRLSPDKVDAFNNWAQSQGIKCPKVSLGVADEEQGQGGLGLRVTAGSSIKKGEVVASVPYNVCFDAKTARKQLSPLLDDFDGWSGAAGCIAVQLMVELWKEEEEEREREDNRQQQQQGSKREGGGEGGQNSGEKRRQKSAWSPWLALLPQPGDIGALDLPLFWPRQALLPLQGCSTRFSGSGMLSSQSSSSSSSISTTMKTAMAATTTTISEEAEEGLLLAAADTSSSLLATEEEASEDFAWLESNVFEPNREQFPPASFGFPQWRRCLGLALSRSFFVDGATRLAPLLDFVNHDDAARSEFVGTGGGSSGIGGGSSGSDASGGGGGGGGEQGAAAAAGAKAKALALSAIGSLPPMFGGGGAGEVRLVAERALVGGEEVCVSYGSGTGAEFLESFGFVPGPSSPGSSFAELIFNLEEKDEASSKARWRCADDKADVLEQAGLDTTACFEVSSVRGGEPDPAMVQFLRLMLLDGQDLFLLEPVFRNEVMNFMALPVSRENEASVGRFVVQRCVEAIAVLDESAARAEELKLKLKNQSQQNTDSSSSSSSSLAKALIMASKVREGERLALMASAAWWRRDGELLRFKEYYQERRLKDLNLDKPWSPEGEVESSFSVGRAPGNADWS